LVRDGQILTGIDRGHITLRDARRERRRGGGGGASGGGGEAQATRRKVAAVALYLVPRSHADALSLPPDLVSASGAKSEERRGTGYLTGPEVRACLDWYVQENGLGDGAGGEIVLDGSLCDVLYGRSRRERLAEGRAARPAAPPSAASRREAHERFASKMDRAYALVEMPGNKILMMGRGSPPAISIEVANVRGRNKFVTWVRGLEKVRPLPQYDVCPPFPDFFVCFSSNHLCALVLSRCVSKSN
jgi:hypothetical protein